MRDMARTPDPKSKAGFVRSLPSTLSAAEVVAKAKTAGVKLDEHYVYAVRTAAKAKRKKGKITKSGGGDVPIPYGKSAPSSGGLVGEIERIVEAKVSAILKSRLGGLLG
jgi:hypothetical protein